MPKTVEEPVSTISLVLTIHQIQYINRQAAERGVSKAKVSRELLEKGIEVDKTAPQAGKAPARTPRPASRS